MLCQNCRQRQATVYFTQVINGKRMEMYLCEQCAKEKGGFSINAPMGINDFFSSLMGMNGLIESQGSPDEAASSESTAASSESTAASSESTAASPLSSEASSYSGESGANNEGLFKDLNHGNVPGVAGIVCGSCGMSYEEFLKTGKMGCAVCYDLYGKKLEPVLKRLHGNISHLGKVPSSRKEEVRSEREITKLKEMLEQAIRHEEYEKAAEFRDKIRILTKGSGEVGR